MNKKLLTTAIVVTSLALACLLIYSIERTAWLFQRFETWEPAAYAAAIVVELAAVALIVGSSALAHLDSRARAWANRALLAVLSVGALANLSAGYLRGGAGVLAQFGSGQEWAPYAVASSLWLVTNLAVPGLILCLSKLLERLIVARGKPQGAARRKRQVRTLIGLLRTWRGQLVQLRGQLAAITAEAASSAAQLRDAADRLRTTEQQSAVTAEQADLARIQSADLSDQLRMAEAHAAEEIEHAQARFRNASDLLRSAQEEAERLRGQLAERSAEAAALSAAAALDVRTIAQTLRDRGVALRTIGAALGVSEKTIRNWTMDVRTNGHLKEG